jgi:peptidoglycan/LPS O-acetylase OafA/YrhL
MKSLLDSKTILGFLLRRAGRIFPGLFVVILISSIIIGPTFTNATLSEYFSSSQFFLYFLNVVLITIHLLPGVFTENPYPYSVNGSLWTLPIEFIGYLIIGMLFYLKNLKKITIIGIAFILFILNLIFTIYPDETFINYKIKTGLFVLTFFFIGSLLVFLPSNFFRLDLAFFLISILFFTHPQVVKILVVIILPYFIISFGSKKILLISSIRKLGDPSYGAYLWAFPVQQIVIASQQSQYDFIYNLLLVTAITFGFGYASFHFIEKFAMRISRKWESLLT